MATEPRILVVDDDDDTRELLSVALGRNGYAVQHAANTDEALARLKASRFDLVLTDYDMPGRSGTALLTAAHTEGLLGSTPVLMLTAHPKPERAEGVDVVTKPFDIDQLLVQMQKLIAAPGAEQQTPPAAGPVAETVELVLYLAPRSPASELARKNVDRVLKRFQASGLRLSVKDPTADPDAAEQDRIVFTPTLLKRTPLPRVWLVGDLSDPSVLVDLLESCGLDRLD